MPLPQSKLPVTASRLETVVPVLKPKLPTVHELMPYLARIDATNIYSNYGPLWKELTAGISRFVSNRSERSAVHTALTSNGTTAIELALRIRARPGLRYCLMPSYTFIASAHAVANAGLEPFLLDVDEHSLAITPEIAAEALRNLPEPPAAILVVSPFGAPPQVEEWESFEERYGIPVVFDAAAAVTGLKVVGYQPLCVSLHATKVFGIGEGGAIICADQALVAQANAMTGFGFTGAERLSMLRGGNYRISEYTASVGLAVLKTIDAKIQRLEDLTGIYLRSLFGSDLRFQDGVGTDWVTMTLNVILPPRRVEQVLSEFDCAGVQWRRWWGLGCHCHPAFARAKHMELSVTDNLAPRVIGIPFFEDMNSEQIRTVCGCLK
jgi:dTDP-4-amino-4,6-dideoxygalactose transaminase